MFLCPAPSFAVDEPVPPAVDTSIARGLAFLARQQQPDGAFTSAEEGGPRLASTSAATLALLSAGQTGGAGRYGLSVRRAVAFLVRRIPEDGNVARAEGSGMVGQALTTAALAEAYGAADDLADRAILRTSLEAMLGVILRAQDARLEPGRGGWNAEGKPGDGDLMTTAWCVLALRSLQDGGFTVPKDRFARAASFAVACYRPEQHLFADRIAAGSPVQAGAALLCLELCGPAAHPAATLFVQLSTDALKLIAEKKLADDSPDPYPGVYMMAAAAQLSIESSAGGTVRAVRDLLISRQSEDGSWPPARSTAPLGAATATSLAVFALTPSYRLLPLYGH